jgi:hypothetical protein
VVGEGVNIEGDGVVEVCLSFLSRTNPAITSSSSKQCCWTSLLRNEMMKEQAGTSPNGPDIVLASLRRMLYLLVPSDLPFTLPSPSFTLL